VIRRMDIAFEVRLQKLDENSKPTQQPPSPDILIQIEKLNEARKRLIKEVNEYEAKCAANVDLTKSTLLAHVDKEKKWSQQMRERKALARYKESYVYELNEEAEGHLQHLKHLQLQLKGFQLGDKMMSFYEKNLPSVGCLRLHNLIVPQVLRDHFKDVFPSSIEKNFPTINFVALF
jgi:hypothetical protein